MSVLIDECAPRVGKHFPAKQSPARRTVQEAGWSGRKNGEFLVLAEIESGVLVAIDTNLRYQQNMIGRRIAILILQPSSNRLEDLGQHFTACLRTLENIKPGDLVDIGVPE